MKFLLVLIAFFAMIVLATALHSCPTVSSDECNGDQGVCVDFTSGDSFCACRSGWAGNDCATEIDEQLACTFEELDNTAILDAPLSVVASYGSNVLTVVVKNPLVNGRNYTSILIDAAGNDDIRCSYPGLYWTRDFDDCTDEFTGVMPWVNVSGCGWVLDESDTEAYTYTANMIIDHHDWIDPFGNRTADSVDRETQHIVPLSISFDKYIDVTANIVVQSPVTLLAGITKQIIAPDRESATIEISTNVIWPYKLTAPLLSLTPALDYPNMGFAVAEQTGLADCPNTQGSTCSQAFTITIDPMGEATNCQITGDYQLSFTIDCQQTGGVDPAECAIDSSTNTATADLSVVSENFCTVVSVDVGISGSLSTFQDNAYSVAKSQFLVGQKIYAHADVTSVNATLTSIDVVSVKIATGVQAPVILFTAPSTKPISSAAFTVDDEGANYAEFFFTLDNAFIDHINQDESRAYTITAKLTATFTGVDGVSKRVAFEASLLQKNLALLQTVELAEPNLPEDDAGSFLAPLAFLAPVAALVALY
jgi:hypothetical protein